MFWSSINRSISAPSVTEPHSGYSVVVYNKTRMLVIPLLPFFLDLGRDLIIWLVSSFYVIFLDFLTRLNYSLCIVTKACSQAL